MSLMERARKTAPNTKPKAEYNDEALWLPRSQIKLTQVYGRTDFEEREEMKNSVADHSRGNRMGIIEPVLVRPTTSFTPGVTHELVAGYRRITGVDDLIEENGWSPDEILVPVVERVLDDVEAAVVSVTENVQRKNPNPSDMGRALANLQVQMQAQLEKFLQEAGTEAAGKRPRSLTAREFERLADHFGDTPAWVVDVVLHAKEVGRRPRVLWNDVGRRVGLSSKSIEDYVRISKLPPDIQEKIADGSIGRGQVQEILRAETPAQQSAVAREVVKKGLTRTQTRARVKEIAGRNALTPTVPAEVKPNPLESFGQSVSLLAETARTVPGWDFKSPERAEDRKAMKDFLKRSKEHIANIERAYGDAVR